MSSEERMARAEGYILGLMDDAERRRAERDLEVDAEFRDCVMSLADRMRRANRAKAPAVLDDGWTEISNRLASLPQMGGRTSGARLSRRTGQGGAPREDGVRRPPAPAVRLAACFIVVFALGYLVGKLAIF